VKIAAAPENVGVVRHLLGVLDEVVGMRHAAVEDVRLAVTEACTNVLRHAYGGTPGPMEIVVAPLGDTLTVIVSDRGRGGAPSPDVAGPHLGLRIMAALSQSIEVEQHAGTGSRVSMTFPLERPPAEAVIT
jgi:serine/threonine-protein kinase RsbW